MRLDRQLNWAWATVALLAACTPAATPHIESSGASASAGQTAPPAPSPPDIVAASDRSAEDRALDPGRRPVELLDFLALEPGMRFVFEFVKPLEN